MKQGRQAIDKLDAEYYKNSMKLKDNERKQVRKLEKQLLREVRFILGKV